MSHFIHAPGPVACRRPPSEPVVVVPGARVCPRVPRLPVTSVDGQPPDRTGNVALEGVARPVPDAVAGNLASLTQDGNLADSGTKPDDFATAAQGAKADTAVQPAAIAGFVDGAEYDANYGNPPKPTILLKHGSEVVATVDAADFVIDGMVSGVKIENGNLVITFNTDSGKQPISIPLTDIFNPANYYTKTDVNGLLAGKASVADATLTVVAYSWQYTEEGVSIGLVQNSETGYGWAPMSGDTAIGLAKGDIFSSDLAWTADEWEGGFAFSAYRTGVKKGYVLGSQTGMAVASEMEAEALRTEVAGKQDALTFDNAPTSGSNNPVKSSGIWSAIWGALAALPTGFTSLYDWVVDQLAGKLSTSGGTMTGGIAFSAQGAVSFLGLVYDEEDYRLRIIDGWNENNAYLVVPNSADGSRVAFTSDVDSAITAIVSDWVSGSNYKQYDVVKYNGVYYYAKSDISDSTTAPSSDDTNWGALANLAALAHLFLPLSGGVMDGSITFGNVEICPFGNKLVFRGLSGDHEVQLSVDKDTDIALLSNIASDFSNSATYALNELCVYNRVLYRCTTAITTAENWTPAHWTEAYVEDIFAALRTGKANTSDLLAKLDSTSAAPAFSSDSSTQYAVGAHCTYNGKLYVCTTATTGGTWVAGSWTADTMTDPDAVLDITSQNQLRVVAKDGTLLWAQGYDLASTSSATLACDAANNFTFADGATSQAFTLPTAPTGKVGDFGLDIDNSANTSAATLTLTGLDSTFSIVVPKGESLTDMLSIAAGELARFYISLSTFRINNLPTWHILKQVVENGGATV